MTPSQRPQAVRAFRNGAWSDLERTVIAEGAIAIVIDGGVEAVMMATPKDLEDFAVGFVLTEGLAQDPTQIRDMEIVGAYPGIEVRLWLDKSLSQAHAARRRRRAGPAGCGLCGVESLDEALRPPPRVESTLQMAAGDILEAMRALAAQQTLNHATHAAHAAALYAPSHGVSYVREDIGRHNALDKLAGALARAGTRASAGAILLTSRLSVELVQKAAMMGAPILAAISAPSSLAIETADSAGLTLIGVVRQDGLEVYAHSERIG